MGKSQYNIFISCKSEDYAKAESVYNWLITKGQKPFFAPISLKISEIHGEPIVFGDEIDSVLEEVENMIVFASKADYTKTGYVKDEWRTFVEEQRAGRKSGSLVTILDGVRIEDLPIRLRSVQSFTLYNYKEGILRFLDHEKTNEIENRILHLVKNNGKYGFADNSENVILPCKWHDAYNFSEGLAAVQNADRMWGFIDKTGSTVIPFKWHSALIFSEGLASVENSEGKYGYIDKKGNIAIPCMWNHTRLFSEGLASVENSEGKYGFIDKKGQLVIPCIWKYAYDFSDGLSCVRDDNSMYGFIDKKGTLVNFCKWDDALDHREGMARVKTNGKYGYIDNAGILVVPCQWDYADAYFRNGKTCVEDSLGNYYIDKKGHVIR